MIFTKDNWYLATELMKLETGSYVAIHKYNDVFSITALNVDNETDIPEKMYTVNISVLTDSCWDVVQTLPLSEICKDLQHNVVMDLVQTLNAAANV